MSRDQCNTIDVLRPYFDVVLGALDDAQRDRRAFEEIMRRFNVSCSTGSSSDLQDTFAYISAWYSRNLLITIRRLVDDHRRVFSLVRLLRKIDELNARDINNVPFNGSEINDDINRITALSKEPVNLANALIAHRTRNVMPRPVPSSITKATYNDLHNVVDELHNIVLNYARRFYASGLPRGPGSHPSQ